MSIKNPIKGLGIIETELVQIERERDAALALQSASPCPGCDWFNTNPTVTITYADVSLMVRFMADEADSTPDEIAYAVEKPWKHADVLAEAKVWLAGAQS